METPDRKIEIASLSFAYDRERVLDNLSLASAAGTFLAVLGPNGSGKSTLLRLISGWLAPARRTVFIGRDDIRSLSRVQAARRLTLLPQETAVEAAFTVREIVLMGRAPHLGLLEREGKIDIEKTEEALALTDATHLAERDITTLSGGERKRVLLAQALAQDTEILLLDEPTAHLDLEHQKDILVLLQRLQREKKIAVVAVLHDLNSAALYADSIVILKEGRIAAEGAPEAVLTEETIKRIFNADARVIPHPSSGRPCVIME